MNLPVSPQPLAPPQPPPADAILWQSFDAAGWQYLERFFKVEVPVHCGQLDHELWKKRRQNLLWHAHSSFTKASQFVDAASADAGRSQIGQTWVEYLYLLQNSSPDPHVTYASRVASLLAKAIGAKTRLDTQDRDASDPAVLGWAYHLIGLLWLESCDGRQAEECLKQAVSVFKTAGTEYRDRACEIWHLLAKLEQCHYRYDRAIDCFQKAEQSSDLERRTRAYLGRVTTVFWIGQTREAWQHFLSWKRLAQQLNPLVHANLLLRGRMLFAAIATRYGLLAEAQQLFEEIDAALRCRSEVSDFCMAVLHVLRAEYYLEKGDVPAMEGSLQAIQWTVPIPRSGYDCFEILYLGSSCRQCLTECWACESWCCDSCGCCTPQVIVFQKDTKSIPLDIQRMLGLFCDGLRGRAHFARGELPQAELALARLVQELLGVFPTDSAVSLPFKVALLRVLQARDDNSVRIRGCSNEILRQIALDNGKAYFAYESDVERALGLWRSELSEDDAALLILERAMPKALIARHRHHPEVLALRSEIVQVQSQLPTCDLCALSVSIAEIVERLSEVVDCYDARRLAAMRTMTWLLLLQHCFSQAARCFCKLEQLWAEYETRNHSSSVGGDARTILGRMAAEMELGATYQDVEPSLQRAIFRIVANSSLAALAHELNHIGLMLFKRKCFRSAYYFLRKSLDQYESMNDLADASTVRKSLEEIVAAALEAGVAIELL